jgi:hypothetical protein
MEEKMEIKEIVLKLGKKEISLSVEEAKKLKELLGELFGKDVIKEVVKEEHHYHDHYRPYWYYQPYYYNQLLCSTTQNLCGGTSYQATSGTLTLNATC